MATHMSHSGMDMYTQASWEADNSCLAAHKVQRMLQPMEYYAEVAELILHS